MNTELFDCFTPLSTRGASKEIPKKTFVCRVYSRPDQLHFLPTPCVPLYAFILFPLKFCKKNAIFHSRLPSVCLRVCFCRRTPVITMTAHSSASMRTWHLSSFARGLFSLVFVCSPGRLFVSFFARRMDAQSGTVRGCWKGCCCLPFFFFCVFRLFGFHSYVCLFLSPEGRGGCLQ